MIWSDTHKFIFFSYPKTGSESVRRALRRYNERPIGKVTRLIRPPLFSHIPPREVSIPRGYRCVSFVRHPYARLASLYTMISQNDRLWRRFGPPPFEEWLSALDPNDPSVNGPTHQAWRQYGGCGAQYWLQDTKGRQLVNDIYRLEDMPEQWPALCDTLGIDPMFFPHRNASKAPAAAITPRAARIMQDKYAYDFERFGYDR